METTSWALGVDLGGTKIEVAAVDASGVIAARARRPTEPDRPPAAIIASVAELIRDALRRHPGRPAGIGVGIAGQVDAADGRVHFAPNLDWHDVLLGRELQRAVDLPVTVTNDVRAATLGEWRVGAARGCDDVVCLFVGTGIGGGIVSGGRLLTGSSNTAGELGHVPVQLDGPSCHCGGIGCVEALAGGRAIGERARQVVRADPRVGATILRRAGGDVDAITAEHVLTAALAGDSLAGLLAQDGGRALAAACVGFVNAFNPACLVLGGGVIEGYRPWLEMVATAIGERALGTARRAVRVVPSRLRGDAGVVGAALQVLWQQAT